MKKTVTLFSLMALASMGFAQAPTTGAPDPMDADSNVISLFSGAYTNVGVNSWRTDWSSGKLTDTTIDGNAMKKYYDMGVVGIETTGANLIDASEMTHINFDLWTSDASVFKIKLVDFGADGIYSPANMGGDDSEHELVLGTNDNKNEWINYQIPLTFFTGLTGKAHMAQYILVAEPFGTATVYIDNIYFSKRPADAMPTAAAADPTADAADVISMFCDKYTDVTVDTWRTPWSTATLEDIQIDGNNVKKYSAVGVIGVEAVGANLIDASEMDYFHISVFSPTFSAFKVKLVDWGADGGYAGGDDTEHELTFDAPAKGEWIDYKIAMSDFTGLTNRSKLAQFIFVAETRGIPTVYIDNVYFSKDATGSVSDAAQKGIRVYPNPATSTLNIDLNSFSAGIAKVEICDIHGRTVRTEDLGADQLTHSLDVSELKSGIYFVNMKSDGNIFTQRIVIE
ncbi:MAG: T9SS type A sorting domain-containing protein [Flavobacteriales bacterium]|nr:T9SS type A sorting domain-containing protein [Flavobacteriales bacterium]